MTLTGSPLVLGSLSWGGQSDACGMVSLLISPMVLEWEAGCVLRAGLCFTDDETVASSRTLSSLVGRRTRIRTRVGPGPFPNCLLVLSFQPQPLIDLQGVLI